MATIDSYALPTPSASSPASPSTPSPPISPSLIVSSPHRRHSSQIPIQQLPPQILLPLVDRPAELSSLIDHNQPFFSLLERTLGTAFYRTQLLPLLKSPRETVDDLSFLTAVRKMLCKGDECSNRIWTEFCCVIGFDPSSTVFPDFSRSSSRVSLSDQTSYSFSSFYDPSKSPRSVSLNSACIIEDDEN
ncbi:hypothetical protein BZA70DRAFT_279413 [Myxozyma melibiosi]|uniref:Uncharacterized protein n=1 Tax=Myxozyma melibiosi TaxID=54550 RepID=A0ABR1F627_9ASCO